MWTTWQWVERQVGARFVQFSPGIRPAEAAAMYAGEDYGTAPTRSTVNGGFTL
jgi:hypothetical protein